MGNRNDISRFLSHAGLTLLWVLMTAYFAFHAFQGESGLGALKRLERQITDVQVIAQAVSSERATLEHRVSMLDDASIDPDMLEEKVREKLGFVHPDEIILFVDAVTIN